MAQEPSACSASRRTTRSSSEGSISPEKMTGLVGVVLRVSGDAKDGEKVEMRSSGTSSSSLSSSKASSKTWVEGELPVAATETGAVLRLENSVSGPGIGLSETVRRATRGKANGNSKRESYQ